MPIQRSVLRSASSLNTYAKRLTQGLVSAKNTKCVMFTEAHRLWFLLSKGEVVCATRGVSFLAVSSRDSTIYSQVFSIFRELVWPRPVLIHFACMVFLRNRIVRAGSGLNFLHQRSRQLNSGQHVQQDSDLVLFQIYCRWAVLGFLQIAQCVYPLKKQLCQEVTMSSSSLLALKWTFDD